jgi:biopolymer transport protein ExbD
MPEKKESPGQRFRREAQDDHPDLNMTPMVDIVFQLLIFFMLGCRFATTEGRINTFLPKNRGQGLTSVGAITLEEVRVKLLWVEKNSFKETKDPNNGRVVLKVENRYFKSVTNQLRETLPDYDALCELLKGAVATFKPTKSYPTRPVIIDARPLVPFKHVVHALNACLKAKITDITFAAPEIEYD